MGPQRLEHRTEDVALAVWRADERLATTEGAWPVVVGVHVINGTWDLAALRFDAPEGRPTKSSMLNLVSYSKVKRCSLTPWVPAIEHIWWLN